MKYQITFETQAQEDISDFKKRNKKTFEKICALLEDVAEHPFYGIGKPEPLRFELAGYWSRRITKEHRMLYKVKNNRVIIFNCKHHY
jgi:toxin YoeB